MLFRSHVSAEKVAGGFLVGKLKVCVAGGRSPNLGCLQDATYGTSTIRHRASMRAPVAGVELNPSKDRWETLQAEVDAAVAPACGRARCARGDSSERRYI